MSDLSPAQVLERIAGRLSDDVKGRVVVIGSVAVGYHFFGHDSEREVRTKDIDCMLAPRDGAVEAGREIALSLLSDEWEHHRFGGFTARQTPEPTSELAAIRLRPPEELGWFIEFLTVPGSEDERGKTWQPVLLDDGYYGLPSFEYLAVTALHPLPTPFGLFYARPSMMALANALAHPTIGRETMSTPIAGREIKRSNKDLGRVLGIAHLAGPDAVEGWLDQWRAALETAFPTRRAELAARAGAGLRALLDSPNDLEEALVTLNGGILVSRPCTPDEIRFAGLRLVQDVVEPLEGT